MIQISNELQMWLEDNIDMLDAAQSDPVWWNTITKNLMMQSSYLVEELIHLLDMIDAKVPYGCIHLWKEHVSNFRN